VNPGDAITLSEIRAASQRLRGRVAVSPLTHSARLSELTGTELVLKLENLQFTGSFKERGACNRLLLLSEGERRAGVVTASAGNHAQALALHASRLGIAATVVMPESTPLVKIEATRHYGARIELWGRGYDDAAERAAEIARAEGLVYVHPFDDLAVIAGQGTLGLELLEQFPDLEAVVVPVGGGGLLAGVACAIKETNPKIRVYGVESEAFPGMRVAYESLVPPASVGTRTIADGIAVRRVGEHTVPLVRRYADGVVLVDEEEIAEAILLLLEKEKTVAEGAGAVGLAALLQRRIELSGRRVAVVVSGGNIDVNLVARIIERGLVKTGRRVRIQITAPDAAGTLARVTQIVAETRANILEIEHDRSFSGVDLGQARIDLVLETHGFDHIEKVQSGLRGAGFSSTTAAPPAAPPVVSASLRP
jgi:threonine dehydratase